MIVIRRYSLVGAGFYWLMYSTAAVLAGLAAWGAQGSPRVWSIVVAACAVVALCFSIAQRANMKSESPWFEKMLAVVLVVAGACGLIAEVLYKLHTHEALESLRVLVGGLSLGSVTSAMLLGHWYLVQPGMKRFPIIRMCQICICVISANIILWFFTPSMLSVLSGSKSDGWGGTLGYMWVGSCVTTIVLLVAARKALNERSYSAVMATTGLLYLAILVANGVELIPRAIFSS